MPIVFALFCLIAAVVLAFYGWGAWKTYQLMKRTVTSPGGELRPGFAEAKGRLVANGPLLASPLSGAPCVYYRVLVQERRSNRNKRWVTLIDEIANTDCSIDDGTGRARIEFDGAELHFHVDAEQSSGFLNDASPALERVLRNHGYSSQGFIFNKKLHCREIVLREGDELYVLGRLEWNDGGPAFSSGGPIYFISDHHESSVQDRKLGVAVLCFLGAFGVLALIAGGMFFGGN
jgi:hypothetical protein